MTITELEKAAIRLAGARDRHARVKHLERAYVLARAEELKRELRRHKAATPDTLPLFEQVQA